MKTAALVLGLLTAGLLSVILAVGNGRSFDPIFNVAIEVLPFCMAPSSALLAYVFFRMRERLLGGLFAANLGLFAVAVAALAFGRPPDARLLFVADVLQLNLYVFALTRHWDALTGKPAASAGAATV